MGTLVQGSKGAEGNFELVLPRGAGGGAWHWWRNNDDHRFPWMGPSNAFGCIEELGATAVIESVGGNLEVVASAGGHLCHTARVMWQGSLVWQAPIDLPGAVAPGTAPSFVQSNIGAPGNFEVVAALAGGGMGHWWRDNGHPSHPWHGPTPFGGGPVQATALFQNQHSGQLEVIARAAGQLQHWSRDDLGGWHHVADVAAGAAGAPDVCQIADPAAGVVHLQVVAPLAGGGLAHWWADATVNPPVWHPSATFGKGGVESVGLIRSRHGHLEVVATFADHLEHWWREATHPFTWFGPTTFWTQAQFVASQQGLSEVLYDTGTVAIHAVLLRTGKVLVWSYHDHDAGVSQAHLIDPVTAATQQLPNAPHAFCSGLATTPDGTVVATGGHHFGVGQVHTFDPDVGLWNFVAEMDAGRWYPTQTCLPDGRVSTMSGSKLGGPLSGANPANNTVEYWSADTGTLSAPVDLPSPWSASFPPSLPTISLYPFVYVLPEGDLFVHARHVTRRYDFLADQWGPEMLAVSPIGRTYPGSGSSVLLALEPPDYKARVLIMGGGGANAESLTPTTPAVATAEIIDLSDPHPQWRFTQSMAHARVMNDAVLLPDGSVVVCGGSASGKADAGAQPVFPIERFDPQTETWATMCDIAVPRLYHSTALLLADARVLMMGKDGIFQPEAFQYPEHRGEVFSPPYLFGGPRPALDSAPDQLAYGQSFEAVSPDAASVDAVRVIRPGAVTHSFNHEQRLVGLAITGKAADRVTATAPPNANIAPPGWYLLFLLSGGVPSVGRFVHIG